MAIWGDESQNSAESVGTLRTWASLYKPTPVSWSRVTEMIRVAESEAQRLESQLRGLVNTSDARLRAISLCEPLLADAGLNRWLKKEREEAYSDWLEWILQQLQRPPGTAADILGVLGITEPEIVANSQSGAFKIDREYHIFPAANLPARRLDLLLQLDDSVMIVVEVKKYSAEVSDTAKQAVYNEWLKSQHVRYTRALLLTTDAAEEEYDNFRPMLWAHVCIRLRRLLPALSTRIGPVKTAMFVAFISAVETNLLNFVVPPAEAVQRLFYAKSIEHLNKYLGDDTV